MKKLLFIMTFALILTIGAFAKTHTEDLFPPEQIEFTLEEHEDAIKYTLFIEEDGIFSLKLISISGTSPYNESLCITLLDKGKELSTFTVKENKFVEDKFCLTEGLAAGEYTLKIQNETMFGDVSFVIDTNFVPFKYIEAQGGSSHENATVMKNGKTYMGGVMLAETSDFYSFSMPKDGYAVIDLYSSTVKYFTLYDEKLNVIGVIDIIIDEPDVVFETRCGLAEGTYYISVSPEEDYYDPLYSVMVKTYSDDEEYEKEYNNTHLTATPIGTSGQTDELRGNLFGVEDVDIYAFSLDSKMHVTAKLLDMYLTKDGHYDFSILEADGTPIITRTKCNTYTFEDILLDKGNYFLSVSCPGDYYYTSFGYKVRVTAQKAEAENESENESENEAENEADVETKDETELQPSLPTPEITQFSDISPEDWFADDILTARKKGLIEGTGNNSFNPMGDVTVAEAVTMAARMYEKHFGAKITPIPNDGGKWYSDYILYAIAAGIINHADFEDYERSATRAEMAYIFAGVLKNADLPGTTADELYIPDVDIEHRYFNQIQLLYKLDILDGVDDIGTFLPENNVTRAESGVIMLRVAKLLKV